MQNKTTTSVSERIKKKNVIRIWMDDDDDDDQMMEIIIIIIINV